MPYYFTFQISLFIRSFFRTSIRITNYAWGSLRPLAIWAPQPWMYHATPSCLLQSTQQALMHEVFLVHFYLNPSDFGCHCLTPQTLSELTRYSGGWAQLLYGAELPPDTPNLPLYILILLPIAPPSQVGSLLPPYRTSTTMPTESQWKANKAVIQDLYMAKNLKLQGNGGLIEHMKNNHGLNAT